MTQRGEDNGGLPSGYYPCEYIESDGKQYINTRCDWDTKYRVVLDVEPLSAGFLFGTRYEDDETTQAFTLYVNNSKNIYCTYLDIISPWLYSAATRSVIEWNENVVYKDGEQIISFDKFDFAIALQTPALFGELYYTPESITVEQKISAKLYSCQMYNSNGVLLRNFIPCFSAEAVKFGLYDKVSKTFFGSETTFDFKGKLAVPSGYSAVEYIYGDGNAFIDTGVTATNNTKVLMDVSVEELKTQIVFGSGSTTKKVYFQAYLNTSKWSCDFGTQSPYNLLSASAGTRYLVELVNGKFAINGDAIATPTSGTFDTQHPVYFMCSHRDDGNYLPTKGSIYFSAIWDNGALVRLFAPCVNSSNVYGLYDLVNKQFYQSAGSSQFGEEPTVYDFDYTGGEQSILLKAGNYKLETWGAQGGAGGDYTANGGKGGYSIGVLNLKKSTTLYINVGGKGGGNGKPLCENIGGYNGGGYSGFAISSECYPGGGGGGATHIATKTGLLQNLASSKSDILIVAGGGGGGGGVGASEYFNEEDGIWEYSTFASKEVKGGDGGGNNGGEGEYSKYYPDESGKGGKGGTLSSSGSGGRRGVAEEVDEDDGFYLSGSGGGGGGGYYGGGGGGSGAITGTYADDGINGSSGVFGYGGNGARATENDGWLTSCGGGGGGGSGYLAPSLTSASSNAGQRSGHGYARITKI